MTQTTQLPTAPSVQPPASITVQPASCPIVINGEIRIPGGITDLDSFRQWLHSDTFPTTGRICFLGGVLWVDLSMEQLYAHNQVKGAVTIVLGTLVRTANLGLFIPDGMHLSHLGAGLSTVPDAIFAFYATLQSGRLQRAPNARQVGAVDLVGTPDMVLEVVSDSSVEKDTVTLPPRYESAGVSEFWRIDARHDLVFEIFRLTPSGYVPTQHPDGWWRSDVFARDFRMTQAADPLGQPLYNLETR
jgi:Uma2 family endonuclease